ncbi:hypothetical protein LALCM10_40077 [Dellaglioa algida]|nr:hypothetical protein LALCM10_40077 [Dellaglioa algida]
MFHQAKETFNWCIEDNKISFNIYTFNVQGNVKINYMTGTSKRC